MRENTAHWKPGVFWHILSPGAVCLGDGLRKARTTVWAVLSQCLFRDRVLLNMISGHLSLGFIVQEI